MAVFYGVFFLWGLLNLEVQPRERWTEVETMREGGQTEKHFDLEHRRINTNQGENTHRKNRQLRRLL